MLQIQRFYSHPSVVNPDSLSFLLKSTTRALFLIIFLLLSTGHALASQVVGLYDVDILVVDKSTSVRQQAFQQGLDEVFIRISGDSVVMHKLKRPSASRYVKQFSYEPVQQSTLNAQGENLTFRLKIQYNGSLIEKYLQDSGFPVWGEHRPDVVVWLAVRGGRNEYVLKETDTSQVKNAADEALIRRGIAKRWPLYDKKDKKILSDADIRGGFKDPLISASKRYSRGPVLAGSMIWNGKQWQSSWSLLFKSGDHHWSLVENDHKVLINKAVDQAADALGVIFATRGVVDKQKLATVQLNIQAVNSIEKYRYVENYLSDLSSVEMVKLLKVDGQDAVFEVTIRSTEEDFFGFINNDAQLIKIKARSIPQKTQVIDVDVQMKASAPDKAAGIVTEAITTKKDDVPLSLNQQNQQPVYHYKLAN